MSFGGIVPLNVQTVFGFCVGQFGWNRSGIGYAELVVACACDISTATAGGNCANRWCAQTAPGGRPSIGPVPPPSLGSTGCCVWFACAVGAGRRDATGFRASTSNRSSGCVKGSTPKRGLGGVPVGICAEVLDTNGLSPRIGASTPAVVNRLHL